jgi:hypothetical protein
VIFAQKQFKEMTAVNSKVLEFCQFMGRLKVIIAFFLYVPKMPAYTWDYQGHSIENHVLHFILFLL